jgi:hypothetical protein
VHIIHNLKILTMQKLSIQKVSLLGLVLMAASAVTAAILPSDSKSDKVRLENGSLTNSTTAAVGGVIQQTCTPTAVINEGACNDTAIGTASGTTLNGGTKSDNTTVGDA